MRHDLIHIIDNKGVPSSYALSIQEFKDLSANELSYVYFMCDHRSPFAVYEWQQREIEVKNSIFGEKKKWSLSSKVSPIFVLYITSKISFILVFEPFGLALAGIV